MRNIQSFKAPRDIGTDKDQPDMEVDFDANVIIHDGKVYDIDDFLDTASTLLGAYRDYIRWACRSAADPETTKH